MFRVVIDALFCHDYLSSLTERGTCIKIAIILRKGARGDLQADTVTSLKDLRSVPAIYCVIPSRIGIR